MEQGNFACSTPVLARQGDLPDQIGASNLNDAVASLLSRPDPVAASENDHDLLQLGVEFDAAHTRWRDAVEVAREPTERHDAVLAMVRTRRHLTMADHKAAEALPGFLEVTRAEEAALDVVANLSERALKMTAHSVQGLAVQARCLIPCVWPEGAFEEKGALGVNEDVDHESVRLIIASCCAAAGVDWKGASVDKDRAAVSVACALPGKPASNPSPDLVAMVTEWKRLMDIENNGHLDDEDLDPICTARMALHSQICAFTATSIADLTAKLPLFLDEVASTAPINPDKPTLDYLSWCGIVRDLEALVVGRGAGKTGDTSLARLSTNLVDQHDRAFHAASNDLRLAKRDHERSVNFADRVWVEQNGGDLSNEAMAVAEAARDAAGARQDQAWRDLFKVRPRTNHQMWLLLRDVAAHFDDHQGMANEPDVFGALIGAADGLRADASELVAPHDLTRLSIAPLEDLADICSRQSRAMLDARKGTDGCPLGGVLEDEQNRIGRLGSMALDEIKRRVPVDEEERNLRLEALARADLAGNGYIEPKLLSELVAAWGAR